MEQDWKDEVLESLKGIQRAEPNPFLVTRIEARLGTTRPRVTTGQLSWAALALLVLVGLNVFAVEKTSQSGESLNAGSNVYGLSTIETY